MFSMCRCVNRLRYGQQFVVEKVKSVWGVFASQCCSGYQGCVEGAVSFVRVWTGGVLNFHHAVTSVD